MKIGAGGLLTGIDIAADGTIVTRADVFGAYVYNRTAPNPGNAGGTGVWQQLCTTTSLASDPSELYTPLFCANGVHEIRIAPSNTSIFYMVYLGYVWISFNKGSTWAKTAFSKLAIVANSGQQRTFKWKMAIDTVNPDVVYFASPANGAFKTTNGTGAGTWSAISGVATADGNGVCCVAIDASSSNSSSPTRKSVVYISVSGTGLYKSTDGGGSFALVSGAPATPQFTDLQVSSDGTVYVVDENTAKLWRLVTTTWTDITPAGLSVKCVTLDPSSVNHIIAWSYNNGSRNSTDAGASYPGSANVFYTMTATDTPMIATLKQGASGSILTNGLIHPLFDPSDLTKIWCSVQQGIFQMTAPIPATPTPVVFTSVSAGIEEIVAMAITTPPNGLPIVLGQDVGMIRQPDVSRFALAQTADNLNFLNLGASCDYASNDPSFVCAVINVQASDASGYSTSYGAAGSWTHFALLPDTGGGGSIAASTNQEMVWYQSSTGKTWYTSNRGASWSQLTGIATSSRSAFSPNQIVAADRVNIGTFYVQMPAATYVVSAGGTSVVSHANSFATSAEITLRSVPGNAGHLFCSMGAIGSGGDAASNWPHAGANALFYYSHDGGTTWADVSGLSSGGFTISEVWAFGLGKNAPGQSYPSIIIYGFVAIGGSPLPAGSQPAFWQSDDNCVTWRKIGDMFPTGWPDWVNSVNGDPNIYGRIYVGSAGSGWICRA